MLRKNLTLKSGVTLERRRVLDAADEFAKNHPELLAAYVTHTFGVDDVQSAFDLACRPAPERVKIAIIRMTEQAAGGPGRQDRTSGADGWWGRRSSGPKSSPRAGYDYVGFDVQHGYLDDADVALLLRRLEHVPIATAVRLPSRGSRADRSRARCRCRRGASSRWSNRPRLAAAAVAATRYAPRGCAASGRCVRAWATIPPHTKQRTSVFAMIETARGLVGTRRDLRVAGPGRRVRRPGGSGDLTGSTNPVTGIDRTERSATPWRVSRQAHRRRGWSRASTPARESTERPWPSWAFG